MDRARLRWSPLTRVVRLFHYAWVAFAVAVAALLIPNRTLQGVVGLAAGVVVAGIGLVLAFDVSGLLGRLRAEARRERYALEGGLVPAWAWRVFAWTAVVVGAVMAIVGGQILAGA